MSENINENLDPSETIVNEPTGAEYSVGEIENSNRIQKSVTPKGTLDWYIKWAASLITLVAITIRSSGLTELQFYDILFSWIGAVGWFVVAFMWKDRALLILNGVISIMLFGAILRALFA